MSKIIEIGNHSDVGMVRKVNEDYYGSFQGKFGELIVICDGMGGHAGGRTASHLAVEEISKHFNHLNEDFDPKAEIFNAMYKANEAILNKANEDESLKGMGSTVVLLLIRNGKAYYAHLGDSRIYLIRQSAIHQLTRDHSLVQQLIDSGILTKDNSENFPSKNVITKALGEKLEIEPDIATPIELFKGDIFILCSDGLTGYIKDEQIKDVIQKGSVQDAAVKLVEMANEMGGKDNTTIQIVKVMKGKFPPPGFYVRIKALPPKIKLILLVSFLILCSAIYYLFRASDDAEEIKPKTENQQPSKQSETDKNADNKNKDSKKDQNDKKNETSTNPQKEPRGKD